MNLGQADFNECDLFYLLFNVRLRIGIMIKSVIMINIIHSHVYTFELMIQAILEFAVLSIRGLENRGKPAIIRENGIPA